MCAYIQATHRLVVYLNWALCLCFCLFAHVSEKKKLRRSTIFRYANKQLMKYTKWNWHSLALPNDWRVARQLLRRQRWRETEAIFLRFVNVIAFYSALKIAKIILVTNDKQEKKNVFSVVRARLFVDRSRARFRTSFASITSFVCNGTEPAYVRWAARRKRWSFIWIWPPSASLASSLSRIRRFELLLDFVSCCRRVTLMIRRYNFVNNSYFYHSRANSSHELFVAGFGATGSIVLSHAFDIERALELVKYIQEANFSCLFSACAYCQSCRLFSVVEMNISHFIEIECLALYCRRTSFYNIRDDTHSANSRRISEYVLYYTNKATNKWKIKANRMTATLIAPAKKWSERDAREHFVMTEKTSAKRTERDGNQRGVCVCVCVIERVEFGGCCRRRSIVVVVLSFDE